MRAVAVALLAACGGAAATSKTVVTLRPTCPDDQFWDVSACKPRGDGAAKIAAGKKALNDFKVDDAKAQLEAAGNGGPLDHDSNVTLWEQRGIASAYVDDQATARTAFDMMLALDPGHLLSYTLSPKATQVFQEVREAKDRIVPVLDVNWPRGQRVGDPVPLDVNVVADPKQFMRRATLFVRSRGEHGWRAADVSLRPPGTDSRVVLPAVPGTKPTSLEVYLRAYDDHGNEVLAWADPDRPREIPLRYDPPTPWYRKWWVIAIASTAVAAGTGLIVYDLSLSPPDTIKGTGSVGKTK